MKKLIIWFGISISCTTIILAFNPPDGSVNMTTDSRIVSVSTISTSPTRLLTKDSYIQRNILINISTCSVAMSTGTTISFSTSFQIPGSSAPVYQTFSPDGVNSPYWGDLYGISNCAGTSNSQMSIFRSK